MLEPVNIVAGGSINRELDLEEVRDSLDHRKITSADFAKNAPWQLLIRFEEEGMVILYRTGNFILRGGSNYDSLNNTKIRFTDALRNSDILRDRGQIRFELTNIVFLDDLGLHIELSQAAVLLGLDCVEYEPEQFSGLIYRPTEFDVVLLVFSTGKLIISGTTDATEAESAVLALRQKLSEDSLIY
jgi:transcription initiation factor TFIID TATA-box-binding protein